MRDLKIGTRLTLGFGFVIVLLLVMSGIGAWRIIDSQQDNQMLNGRLQTSALIQQLARQVSMESSLAQGSLAADPDTLRELKAGIEAADQRIRELLERLTGTAHNTGAGALLRQVAQGRDAYLQTRDLGFKNLDSGNFGEANVFLMQELPTLTTDLLGAIDRVSQQQADSMQRLFDESAQSGQLGMTILGVATLLALLLGPLFAWRVTRSITH
ncbi:MCP four helix bundle domain-containing protein, partial [Castellaniella sp. GW247-6E4]|uniref:MCP four helix bundle domain-containing protein n=1 Tax=Castellaniella sp. GW247-6E4 TaxID=3140380 RepID=UPI0033160507